MLRMVVVIPSPLVLFLLTFGRAAVAPRPLKKNTKTGGGHLPKNTKNRGGHPSLCLVSVGTSPLNSNRKRRRKGWPKGSHLPMP